MMLANIEQYLEDARIRSAQIVDAETVQTPKHNIEDIHAEIDRLNYSWQKGRIRTVEQYEEQYAELMERLAEAEQEQPHTAQKDFSKIEAILHSGWREIYKNLDDEHRQAFWRSFVRSIEVNWTTEKKEIVRVNFL
jgi:trans-aconitate methyltransferase